MEEPNYISGEHNTVIRKGKHAALPLLNSSLSLSSLPAAARDVVCVFVDASVCFRAIWKYVNTAALMWRSMSVELVSLLLDILLLFVYTAFCWLLKCPSTQSMMLRPIPYLQHKRV